MHEAPVDIWSTLFRMPSVVAEQTHTRIHHDHEAPFARLVWPFVVEFVAVQVAVECHLDEQWATVPQLVAGGRKGSHHGLPFDWFLWDTLSSTASSVEHVE